MKAIVYHDYGSADVLKYEEIEKPVPKDDEVLIKIRAASINPLDWRLMHGEPKALRFMTRLMGLGSGRPGVDASGTVDAAGANVKQFKPGDNVFGGCRGALAEYGCSRASKVASKPDNVTFEQAASMNVAGLTALQGLRDKAQLRHGQKVLVNGAAGGVGTFAVQVAKLLGAEVTGVCSTRNLEMVKSIGADAVIDYTQEDFTQLTERYDLIFDCVGNKSFSELKSVLNPGGSAIPIGGPHDLSVFDLLAIPFKVIGASLFSNRKIKMFIAKSNRNDLTTLGEWTASGKLTPVIDRTYNLSEAAEAMRYLEEGHARGKVIVTMNAA
jgi:NADPH:quinone reductase-like Zn-dependent oxidoreductase